ncbi:MAG: TonB-dependent receptor, partial [Myxococcota bacterium]
DLRADGSLRSLAAIDAGPLLNRGQRAIFDRTTDIRTLGVQLAPAIFLGEGTLRSELSFSLYSEVFESDQRNADRLDRDLLDDRLVQGLLSYDRPFGDHHLLVGAEVLYQDLTGDRFPGFEDRIRASGFVQDEWQLLAALTINGGVRLDYDSQFDVAVSPRIAGRFEPWAGVVFRASWGLGFKAPLPLDLGIQFTNNSVGYTVQGNPDLLPERASTFSAEASFAVAPRLTFSFGGFYSEVENLINFAQVTPNLFMPENVSEARLMGLEASLEYKPWRWLRFGVGYDGVDARNLSEDRVLENRAPHRVSGQFGLRFDPVRFDVQSAWTDVRTIYGTDEAGNEVALLAPAFVRLDARMAVTITQALEVFLGGDNLLDAGDDQFLFIAPRTLYVGLRGTLR